MAEEISSEWEGARAKARAPTPVRATSGAGFEFEDLVSAWLQVKMLVGEPAPGIGASAFQIQAQVSSLGWCLDDLLLTAAEGGGPARRLAISAKGNIQVTATTLPKDFVERAWAQWRDPQTPMNRSSDVLALITLGAHREFAAAWRELKNACAGSDVALAMARIRENTRQSKLFDSAQLDGETSDEQTVALIRQLLVIPVDLQDDHSEIKSQAVARLRVILTSGDLAEANKVWDELVTVAKEVRIERGTMTLQDLWARLRQSFSLRDHPDFSRDWQTLSDLTTDLRDRIETTLANGHVVMRESESTDLRTAFIDRQIITVFGDSGTGKSALVRSVLDSNFGDWNQVWLGSEELKFALSAARRGTLPLKHDLAAILHSSANPQNALVLESAEHIDPADAPLLLTMLQGLLSGTAGAWRVIVVTQNPGAMAIDGGVLGTSASAFVEIKRLDPAAVKSALRATPEMAWLANHAETVDALTNVRTLSWVLKAGAALAANAGALASHTAIADRLWDYWTDSRPDVQSLMMRLAQREASFERSFPLTELAQHDAATFTQRPRALPLRLNARKNHVEFEHDLAADWSRFQFLKQIADDTAKWSALADNPLWTNALRLLGQSLLREARGASTAWDVAIAAAEANNQRLIADILFDAISLDPQAERFLTERAEFFFAENGRRLARLLTRFHHLATVPIGGVAADESILGLYLESQHRTVMVGRWAPILRFVIAHQARLGELVLSEIAQLAQTWLTGTPATLSNGEPFPLRKELAEIALAMARTVQVQKGYGVIYADREPLLYTAPLSGVADIPDEVSTWALELAGRRDESADVSARIAVVRRQQAEQHEQRMRSDAAYRARHEQREHMPRFLGSSREPLPPWPLGARDRVDRDFQSACFKSQALAPLMRVRPQLAAELLLALIIEDQPYRDFGGGSIEPDLGLDFPEDAYPTSFLKSPFFSFLQIAPHEALGALIALVNFCTERWVAEGTARGMQDAPAVRLLVDGREKSFVGSWRVFDWTQSNSTSMGNLSCALDALERWITFQIDAGHDVSQHIARILHEGASAAFVGLLINVAKYRPALMTGDLGLLIADQNAFVWDRERVKHVAYNFDALSWSRLGDPIYSMAQSWTLAEHRKTTLAATMIALLKAEPSIAAALKSVMRSWTLPADPKSALEAKLLQASLDRDNYERTIGADGAEVWRLIHPAELAAELAAWEDAHANQLRYLTLPEECRKALDSQQAITDDSAVSVFKILCACELDEAVEADIKSKCLLASAAVLIVCAREWLALKPEANVRVVSIVRNAVDALGAAPGDVRSRRIAGLTNEMAFAAFAVMDRWRQGDIEDAEWERLLLRLLTSGDSSAVQIISAVAYAYRNQLGETWWRLLQVGVLWSGLTLLEPRSGDDEASALAWACALERIRRAKLRGQSAAPEDLRPARVAAGTARLKYDRDMREFLAEDKHWRREPAPHGAGQLDWHFLSQLFAWLLKGHGSGDWRTDRAIIAEFWAYESARARARARDSGEYDLPSQMFGYDVLEKLARLTLSAPNDAEARSVWELVIEHGPEARVAIAHFFRSFFAGLSGEGDKAKYEEVWRNVMRHVLSADWKDKRSHDRREIICAAMGFGQEKALLTLASGAALRMRDLYETWAKDHLRTDNDCLVMLAVFLTTEFGSPLRLPALPWIADALSDATRGVYGWRRDGVGEALVELLNTCLVRDNAALAADAVTRQALLRIAGALVARNVAGALTLQERIKLVH